MVYLVVGGEYEDWFIEGYFEDYDLALKYCAMYPEKKYYVLDIESLNDNLNKINNSKFIYTFSLVFTISKESVMLLDTITHSYCLPENQRKNKIYYVATFMVNEQKPRIIMDINAENQDEAIQIALGAIAKMSNNGTKEITQKEVDIMNATWGN